MGEPDCSPLLQLTWDDSITRMVVQSTKTYMLLICIKRGHSLVNLLLHSSISGISEGHESTLIQIHMILGQPIKIGQERHRTWRSNVSSQMHCAWSQVKLHSTNLLQNNLTLSPKLHHDLHFFVSPTNPTNWANSNTLIRVQDNVESNYISHHSLLTASHDSNLHCISICNTQILQRRKGFMHICPPSPLLTHSSIHVSITNDFVIFSLCPCSHT